MRREKYIKVMLALTLLIGSPLILFGCGAEAAVGQLLLQVPGRSAVRRLRGQLAEGR
jgi:hypothetical protein